MKFFPSHFWCVVKSLGCRISTVIEEKYLFSTSVSLSENKRIEEREKKQISSHE
jgi:hypothetical protein